MMLAVRLPMVLILLFGSLAPVFSQPELLPHPNQIKFFPMRLLDPVHSGIELAYERKLNPHIALQPSVVLFVKNNFNKEYENFKGRRLALEGKYYFPYRVRNSYVSVEAAFLKNSFTTVGSFEHDSTLTSRFYYYSDSILIRRNTAVLNIRTGRLLILGRFVTDISLGIGLRFRKVVHEGRLSPGDKLSPPRHPNIPYEANREKKDAVFNLPFNIGIGYLF